MPSFLELRNIVKVYPNGVVANDGVDFSVEQGEIHALVGENGAGKTTLMKILYGLERPSSGEISLQCQLLEMRSPHDAIDHGIGMVHQNFMLIPSFTVAENIVLGEEPARRGLIQKREAVRVTEELSRQYGLRVNANAVVDSINVGLRQRVEILKTLYRGVEILILDEPTAFLTPQETEELFDAIRSLVDQGKTVIFITHKLGEVLEISDRVTVMRAGRVVGTIPTSEATREGLASMMVGREVILAVDKPPGERGEAVLKVKDLSYISGDTGRQVIKHIAFNVYAGEILGVAGVEGNGQTELVEVLTGLRQAATGTACIDSKDILNTDPRNVRMAGVSHIPDDRMTNGLALLGTIEENLIVDRYFQPPYKKGIRIDRKAVTKLSDELIKEYNIRTINGQVLVTSLSGGNMQKVIVAREFSSAPELLIAAQPTRGIDVGAAEFVRQQLVLKRTQGTAVLLVSADLSEVMNLSDRIIVMFEGEITGVFPDAASLTEGEIGLYMLGIKRQEVEEMESLL